MSVSDAAAGGNVVPCTTQANGAAADETGGRRTRTRRLPLSCGECRKKKLSCDRNLPCRRCIRSGRPGECAFEADVRPTSSLSSNGIDTNAIEELRAEVAELKALLSNTGREPDGSPRPSISPASDSALLIKPGQSIHPTNVVDPKARSPRGYYQQNTLFQFFYEIPQLFPIIKETAEQWLDPRGVSLRKPRMIIDSPQPTDSLERLLPPKDDTDVLVSFYLEYFEHIHHVVHIPTFKREYAKMWLPERARHTAATTLVLAMISISTASSSSSTASTHWSMPPRWIAACDEWLSKQTLKRRELVYHQVACLVYLAKRMNNIRKKRFWMETGSMIQNAILDMLHCEPPPTLNLSPYTKEMRRRVWAVLRELELQNSFEYKLPTLLHSIYCDIAPPANLDDEDFDETTMELPTAKPPGRKTISSYQSQSARTWGLRLEISRRFFDTGVTQTLAYNQVLRYTDQITQALDSLSSWETRETGGGDGQQETAGLVSALLQFQLKECILVIHRNYVEHGSSRHLLSVMIYNQAARDILIMNRDLADLNMQSLTFFRENLLMASLSLTRIALLQPKEHHSRMLKPEKASHNNGVTGGESTLELLEQCLPFIEDRYLRCFYGEPWCPLTMYGATMLLRIHLGKDSREAVKSSDAQRFLDLYYRHIARQEPSSPNQFSSAQGDFPTKELPTPATTSYPASEHMTGSAYPEIDFDLFGSDFGWDDENPPIEVGLM